MIKVQVRPNENLEAALRRFKRQCNFAGIFRLAKRASTYEKPSEKRRREARERVRNIQRALRKQAQAKARRKVTRKVSRSRPEPATSSAQAAGTQDEAKTQAVTEVKVPPTEE